MNESPIRKRRIALTIALALTACLSLDALADDNEQLNGIYRLFFESPVIVEKIAMSYRQDIIHVGRADTPLITGKSDFLNVNIKPLAAMVNSSQLEFRGTAYVLRRLVHGNMANDVGYLHSVVTMQSGESHEQVQKFSWVFVKEDGLWRVVTDFDATNAPLSVLENTDAEFVID